MSRKEEGRRLSQGKRGTSTSSFGVSRRESHDASPFYSRFKFPVISTDDDLNEVDPAALNKIHLQDARDMKVLPDNSVALVVTSPPYFAGKEYEVALGQGNVPATYIEYLEMLEDVFAECARVLEPGGRIAVNVANLGRRPYRSLAADVIHILQDRLGLLLRGEIIWQKGRGASGSCAWGSFQSASNPVLRDVTERIVIAGKGRFDRAVSRKKRERSKLPWENTIGKDDFVNYTVDVWEMPTESARRIGHPAPFPVELPTRLIDLYTYLDDVVLDPFIGSGTTAVAALRTGRRFVGFETDEKYKADADRRIENERKLLAEAAERRADDDDIHVPAVAMGGGEIDPQRRAVMQGKMAKELALEVLTEAGFVGIESTRKLAAGIEINFEAKDSKGRRWFFDVSGAFTSDRPGLQRTDTLWKALGRAAVLKGAQHVPEYRLVFLTTDLPAPRSAGDVALRAVRGGELVHDVIPMLSRDGIRRLKSYARGEGWDEPLGDLLA
jgi:site-specific DNA-methyltransferase (adenine-specific)